ASKKLGPKGAVYAIEPLAKNVKVLLANKLINDADNVTIYPFGASEKEGLLTLMSMGSIASSREASLDDAITANSFEFCYARPIDDVIPTDAPINVIKIDIDGFDYRALLGAQKTLQTSHPDIFAEFFPPGLESYSGVKPIEYLRLMKGLGY